jgi:hypothetical protein
VKAGIISRAGPTDVLLPSLIAEGLSAKDRVKARLSILQAVQRHARHPAGAQFDLRAQCSAAGIDLGIDPHEAASAWDFGTGGHSADDNDCSIT